MSLLPFFEWCYQTGIGETIRNSSWLFPVIEAIHLIGLGLTVGAVLLVDLRLLGVGLSRQPVALLSANAQPWLFGGVALMFATGIPLFLSESIKAYYSFAFWVKMTSLFAVLIFTLTVRKRVVHSSVGSLDPSYSRLTGFASIFLWFGVAWGGRWIGFS